MKRLTVSLLFCLVSIFIYGQDFFMYVNGQKRSFEASVTKMLVKSERLDATGIKDVMQRTVAGNVKNIHDLNNRLFMIDMQNISKENLLELQKQWSTQEGVLYSSPVFIDETDREIAGLTNQIIVRLKKEADYPLLAKSILPYQIKDIRQCEYDKLTYFLILEKGSVKDAMQTANELHETGLYEYAEPNLIHFIELSTADSYYSQQWALKNTGQTGTSGIDIKAEEAWVITAGSPNIRIAVLDVGVDLSHPDLVNNLLPGFDATGNNSAGAPTGNIGDYAHGTACAGIIAAQANNNRGIAGVAYNCRILPVRVATRSDDWATTESLFITNAINWARQNGADVISMSFKCELSSALNTAITNAVNTGRNNRGCVLVAASGNGDIYGVGTTTVSYPANNPNVIAVGAINNNGSRATFSDHGTNLDVVAPGVYIHTTDIQGSAGYNKAGLTSGDYYASFNGTSAACPHVAGIAALILSIRPDLTQAQVRQAIESSCTKLSGYSFSSNSAHPNSTWNSEVGYGLVNAYAALASVVPPPPIITGPAEVCWYNGTFTLNNPPPSGTVQWSVTFPFSILSVSGNQVVVKKTSTQNSGGTLTAKLNGSTIATKSFTTCPLSINGASQVSPQASYYYAVQNHVSGATYSWDTRDILQITSTSSSTATVYVPNVSSGEDIIGCLVTFNGVSTYVSKDVSIVGWSPVSAYPNPASGVLNIEIDANAVATQRNAAGLQSDPTYDIRLYDGLGNIVRQQRTKSSTVQFNVTNLQEGTYYLHIYDGVSNKAKMTQIIVQH